MQTLLCNCCYLLFVTIFIVYYICTISVILLRRKMQPLPNYVLLNFMSYDYRNATKILLLLLYCLGSAQVIFRKNIFVRFIV